MGEKIQCPYCSSEKESQVVESISLLADSWWDEIVVKALRCPECGGRTAGIYREERRGSLDSELWRYEVYALTPEQWDTLWRALAQCPKRYSLMCQCATHRALGQVNEQGDWVGLSGVSSPFFEESGRS